MARGSCAEDTPTHEGCFVEKGCLWVLLGFKHLRPDRDARPGDRIESLYRAFKRAARAVSAPTLRPHDLRHAFVTRKLADGVPAQLVMRYVGHADLATTLRYTHLVPEHVRTVVDSAAVGHMRTNVV